MYVKKIEKEHLKIKDYLIHCHNKNQCFFSKYCETKQIIFLTQNICLQRVLQDILDRTVVFHVFIIHMDINVN